MSEANIRDFFYKLRLLLVRITIFNATISWSRELQHLDTGQNAAPNSTTTRTSSPISNKPPVSSRFHTPITPLKPRIPEPHWQAIPHCNHIPELTGIVFTSLNPFNGCVDSIAWVTIR